MPIETKTGNINDTAVSFNTSKANVVYAYIDLPDLKTTTQISLNFAVYEQSLDKEYKLTDNSMIPITLNLTAITNGIYKIEIPSSAEELRVYPVFSNSSVSDSISLNSDGVTTSYSTNLVPIVDSGTVSVSYTITGVSYTATDDGNGNISGTNLTGTIDYNTGELSLTFSVAPDSGTLIGVSYSYTQEATLYLDIIASSPYR